ncbi:sucrase ferredoxin [Paenibacillus turpanensis]|uniref:sucrase ferredoxin n=1 Tax=Paenibacillus turpanensis TaxID=2689078 RepID=UPI00140CFC8B|nr:sucrase ferredoxin [Paenibacillus turpanensis]
METNPQPSSLEGKENDSPSVSGSCALISRLNQEDPVGSAPAHHNYIFVEVPMPWLSRVEESRHFPAGLQQTLGALAEQGHAFRFLAFVSEAEAVATAAGFRRVIHFHRPVSGLCASYQKREYVIPEEKLQGLVRALAEEGSELEGYDAYAVTDSGVRDLFVCTHGTRDQCCGKLGVPLYKEIEQRYMHTSNGAVRVWRTSHIGGHRYAPTMIDFPEGRYWAHVEPGQLPALILREGSFQELFRNYRGWGAIGALAQPVEREAFLLEGWDWIQYEKEAQIVKKEDGSASVRLHFRSPDGGKAGVYEADVAVSGTVPTGGCGGEPGHAKQYKVTGLKRLNTEVSS